MSEIKCNPHPLAPHGFNRDASHSLDRYVCDCEFWSPDEKEAEIIQEDFNELQDDFDNCQGFDWHDVEIEKKAG